MARLELVIMAGAESKEWLNRLESVLTRMEKLNGLLDDKTADTDETEDSVLVDVDDADDEDFAPKKKPAKKGNSFDEDEDETEDAEEDEDAETTENEEDDETEEAEEDDEPAPKKKSSTKAKKLTVDDCNDAARELAKKHGRSAVLDIMKKNFKTKSVTELKPEHFGKFIELMNKAKAK